MSYTTLTVQSAAIPLHNGTPALHPVRLSGQEGVNSLFEYELLLKTPDALNFNPGLAAQFDLDGFIGRELTCLIELDGAGEFVPGSVGPSTSYVGAGRREISGLVTHADFWGEEGRHIQYRLTLRPWLYLATLTTDCKIFQNKTVVEILDELLSDYPYSLHKRLYERYPKRDFQVQYNETDFAFFERLCQEWGINFHFEHAEGVHRLVLSDGNAAFDRNDSEAYHVVEYHAPGWKVDAEYIHSFVPTHQLTSGRYVTNDYDYTRPRADLTAKRRDPRPTGQADGEIYQWHEGTAGTHFAQPRAGTLQDTDPFEEGRLLSLLRMQALRTHGARARASGNLRGMQPGHTFMLAKHPRTTANAEYIILQTQLCISEVAQDSQAQAAATHRHQRWAVEVDLTVHPVREPLRPLHTRAKPFTRGPATALVVGPENSNLWTDELGRIKVQFLWDRLGRKDQHSSCWLRVSSPWAGNQLGAIHIPRVGQEVVVDFLGGDPDLPICTGRVHNQLNLPPWHLPDQAALSGVRSRELNPEGGNSASGRSNHLVLDDTYGAIQAQIKSDHQHSQLSLGKITRIEDNAGRKDPRGEGFELRTDGPGAIRAQQGLLISTEGRERAEGHIKDMAEALSRLDVAQRRHETLAGVATHHGVQPNQEDQHTVAEALGQQHQALAGAGAATQFPELSSPHLVLSSPAGIEATTHGSLHLASEAHTAITAGGHASVVASGSLLASAEQALRLFAKEQGVRVVAGEGAVQVQAQDDRIELIAKRVLELISESDWIRIKAAKGISLEVDGTRLDIVPEGFTFNTPGNHHVWAADVQNFGPKTAKTILPKLPERVCIPCLMAAARAGSAISTL
ncbi:type VI secretion system Vgr family protein [Pseudacidovorax sp. RU35E]|uniref:type VI secretion system Vgr family protein n=1 Tax=Pseudacidovorax sp. RU35E TaxID=1907403 RepID=UPI000954A042|nr:type VI secretion system Vgr family protein [Pseudacidovorax sp. RU35E]SIR68260.1 type VI secretion system secreted protein VgrG [Pseudacidovorax sp. RU35E]